MQSAMARILQAFTTKTTGSGMDDEKSVESTQQ